MVGFLPRTKEKIEKLIKDNEFENLVFYESPQRLIETLNIIKNIYPDKKITIGRELTKKFEQIITDSVDNVIEFYKNNILKGEIAALLHKSEKINNEINLEDKIEKLKKLNFKDKEISLILSSLYDINKNIIYKKCLK